MGYKLAVIGVGNMARAIISGTIRSNSDVSEIYVYDKNRCQYQFLDEIGCDYFAADSVTDAVKNADCVLLAVKPQNYDEVLAQISTVQNHNEKLYITIAAGITVQSISKSLNNAKVVRVLPNLPMTVGLGVSVICRNPLVNTQDFDFVTSLFSSSGTSLLINECEMNRIIGVTSSSPAYVFKFIDAICKSAILQGLPQDGLKEAICDVFIGAATLLKQSDQTAEELIARVCSKGGTTEQAIGCLENADMENIIHQAMVACTKRAEELGNLK